MWLFSFDDFYAGLRGDRVFYLSSDVVGVQSHVVSHTTRVYISYILSEWSFGISALPLKTVIQRVVLRLELA